LFSRAAKSILQSSTHFDLGRKQEDNPSVELTNPSQERNSRNHRKQLCYCLFGRSYHRNTCDRHTSYYYTTCMQSFVYHTIC
jgi:hypothetical protein